MLKITNLKDINKIDLKDNKIFYIYGKIGSGKTYLTKEIINKNNKKAVYTSFYKIIEDLTNGKNLEIEKEEILVVDYELKDLNGKEFTYLTLQRQLENVKENGNTIIMISTFTPKELEETSSLLAKFILSGEQINLSYNLETRMEIAEKHIEQLKIKVEKEEIMKIVKEKNDIGKILANINRMKICY